MFRPRVGEVRKVSALLEAEHDDVESLAYDVLDFTSRIVFERDAWIVVMANKLGVFVYGVFWTRKQAEDAMLNKIVEPGPDRSRFYVTKLMGVNND
jgi:hypothetical protein